MASPITDGWLPVAEAAEAHGIPLRTVYNWIKAKRLETRTSNGVTLVSPEGIREVASQRTAGNDPASAGTNAGTGAGNGNGTAASTGRAAMLDGDLAAQLFEAFDQGESPTDLVQKLRIPPAAALAAWRQYQELRGATGSKASGSRLDELEETTARIEGDLREWTWAGQLATEVWKLRRALDEVQKHLAALPVPRRDQYTCSCGHQGFVATHVRCTACGADTTIGFHPQRAG